MEQPPRRGEEGMHLWPSTDSVKQNYLSNLTEHFELGPSLFILTITSKVSFNDFQQIFFLYWCDMAWVLTQKKGSVYD